MEEINKKKLGVILGILLCFLVSLGTLVFFVFRFIAKLITVPGSIILFVYCFVVLIRMIIRYSVFPGSSWLWKRSIEFHFCKEMSTQLLQRVQDIRLSLEVLLDSVSDEEKEDFLPRACDSVIYAKRMVQTIIETFYIQKEEGTLTTYQESLLELLLGLTRALENTKVHQDSPEAVPLWEWFETVQSEADWVDLVFEDFPENSSAMLSLEVCVQIEERVLQSCGEVDIRTKVARWMRDTTLGTIDQMRLELEYRFNAEQVWITADDNVNIDCLWVPSVSENSEAPTILLCNPNAGFYEFAYYQSEWLEHYVSSGANVFMWNYRGYGRTKGKPDPSRLKNDGEIIVDYLKRIRRVTRLGVHGESLGGWIACHLARYCDVDFLYADRSFSSLENVASYNFGNWANKLLRLATKWKGDASWDYLFVDCYKVLSADPYDSMINDLASLKSAVAIRMLETNGTELIDGIDPAKLNLEVYCHILDDSDTEMMLNSVLSLMKYTVKYMNSEQRQSSEYEQLNDISVFEEEHLKNVLNRVFGILDSLDSGGKPLSSVYMEKKHKESLKLWLIVLDIWGSFVPILPGDLDKSHERAIEKVKQSVEELDALFKENQHSIDQVIIDICRQVKILQNSLVEVLHYLEEQPSNPKLSVSESQNSTFLTGRGNIEYSRAGYLIPLSCGHSGHYNPPEKLLLQAHLTRAGIIHD